MRFKKRTVSVRRMISVMRSGCSTGITQVLILSECLYHCRLPLIVYRIYLSRLMSGLQASISVHIAKEYYYPEGHWGPNYPLFHRAVGDHRDRVNNLFFAFLFVLRAVVKSKESLLKYDFGPGDQSTAIRHMIEELVSARLQMETSSQIMHTEGVTTNPDSSLVQPTLEQCRKGFDESLLFQVCTFIFMYL